MSRYLTKSLFKIGLECPTKLFYAGKKEYFDHTIHDSFLEALAQGGYQVNELAKHYFPNGYDLSNKSREEAIELTKIYLKQDKAVIYEASVMFCRLLTRTDILIKDCDYIELIEVKAKSFDDKKNSFLDKNGHIRSDWMPYLSDVAFQKYVFNKAFPSYTIKSFLMLADKNAVCQTDDLNQKIRIIKDKGMSKKFRIISNLNDEDVKERLLIKINIDEYIEKLFQEDNFCGLSIGSFEEVIKFLSEKYCDDELIPTSLGSKCAKCQFKCNNEENLEGLRSGYKDCWSRVAGWKENDFAEPNILDLWNFRRKDNFIKNSKLKLIDIEEGDINPRRDNFKGLSSSQRQWMQIKKVKANDNSAYIDHLGLKSEMEKWIYPLHFIDFETCTVAIPFNKGCKPYEGIAFQFSHHIVNEDGTVEHAGQFLKCEPSVFPNFDFLRALKKQLEKDSGTIFRYHMHENTYLKIIYEQLQKTNFLQVPDRNSLLDFIKTITESGTESDKKSDEKWIGDRNMIDLYKLVLRYYYNPLMKGFNSIKVLLPAVLNSSYYLQEKYSKPIYGDPSIIKSKNFVNWQWVQWEENKVVDPYKLLPRLFTEIAQNDIDLLSRNDEIVNGGEALVAYCLMQFSEMPSIEREELKKGLLKYCELDSFAMVMIYEAWREDIKKGAIS